MRPISAAVRAGLEREASPDALLAFLTVTHPRLVEPIRLVSDVFDYLRDGQTFVGLPFGFVAVTDEERAPVTQLTVQNVDRRIGEALRTMPDRATVQLEVLSSADFDLSANPRVPLGALAPIYAIRHFQLIDVTATVTEITGTLMLRDYSQEPWPGQSATQSVCPGLFR
ncbi:DUF1833 family protein [Paenirhodobacter sp. CAU 1674]|uniref:DUF1833 family protein n=1 Tax=Paenirhodobacter sp. CAU 1674 TaxID=3032596 RepID=UPI0023DBA0BF|nr:DUF1833 family protein [Paenirhodobacter sp. CAU 1674]MDF2140861.1 DUF1833 family protein [Paenirhodobacter sp. CAU 1674]